MKVEDLNKGRHGSESHLRMQTNRGEGQVLLIPGREFVMREHAPRVASEIWFGQGCINRCSYVCRSIKKYHKRIQKIKNYEGAYE